MTTAELAAPEAATRAHLERVHDVLVLLLVFLRPLCWDGAPGQLADTIWQSLALIGLLLVAIERATLIRLAWTWSWRGVFGMVLLAAFLPCTLYAPESASAWCRFAGWTACMAAAVYLTQVLPGRIQLAVAALLSALAIETVLGVLQLAWVLPAMAAAQRAGDAAFTAIALPTGDVAERIANGGVFTTFTLANQFAAYLVLTLPLLIGTMWAGRGRVRWFGVVVCCLGTVALVGTHTKGAWLALVVGCGCGWYAGLAANRRFLLVMLMALAVVAIWQSHAAHTSIDVRLGYWRAAVAMIVEQPWSGHGLGGFATYQPQYMAPGDEPTRMVHNEPLEAAVSGGLWLGIGGLIALISLAWPRRNPRDLGEPIARTIHPALGVLLVCIMPYLAALGAFDGNLAWWPGGESRLVVVVWSLLLGCIAAFSWNLLLRLPALPAWTWTVGLVSVAAKACIDFDFHAGGVLGTALIVACCAPGVVRSATGTWSRWAPLVLAAGCAGVLIVGAMIGYRLALAESWIADAQWVMRDPKQADKLASRLEVPRSGADALAAVAAERAWDLGEGSSGIRYEALHLMPKTARVLAMAEQLAEAAPASAGIQLHFARRLLAAQRWQDAAETARRAGGIAWTDPRVLTGVVEILEPALVHGASLSVGWPRDMQQIRKQIDYLKPLVHPRMRLP